MQKFNFDYDKENDDLFLFSSNSKSKGSIELGDIILDYDSKKELVGIQFLNAVDTIKDFIKEDVKSIKEILDNLKECRIDIKKKGNFLFITIFLVGKKEIMPVLSIPMIEEKSPGHRANILDPESDRIGVGIAYDGLYYVGTQNFR